LVENAEPVISRSEHICNRSLRVMKGEKEGDTRIKIDLPTNIDAWGGDKDLRKLLKID
jgi:hypothetical protein